MRHTLRFYLGRPGFTLVTLLTLAAGISAVTAVFSVANAVLLRPLPYANADRLVLLWEDGSRRGGSATTNVASSNFVDWREQNQVFDEMAIVRNVTLTLTGLTEPYNPLVHRVSANYFQLLGTSPLMGRTFHPGEDAGSPAPVVVLSYGLWQRRFGGDPQIVGRPVLLDDVAHTVVGVMRRDFYSVNFFPTQPELWVPLSLEQIGLERSVRRFLTFGRLKPDVTLAQAREEMRRVATNLQGAYPDTNKDWGVTVTPIREQVVGDFRRPLVLLLLAASFVLAIACFNVANLLLARGADRGQEIAIRLALGGTPSAIFRQLLAEHLLLAFAGGGLGLLIAAVAAKPLVSLVPMGAGIPFLDSVAIDARVCALTFVLCAISGVLFGLVPSRQAFHIALATTVRQGGRTATRGALDHRLRHALIVVEIALSVALLMGEGLLLRTFQNLRAHELGFAPSNLVLMTTSLRGPKYQSPEQRADFYRHTVETLRTLPGVVSASAATGTPPLSNFGAVRFAVAGQPEVPGHEPHAVKQSIEPAYFQTMGIPLLSGRANDDRDTRETPAIAVINQTLARRWFPNRDPVGQVLRFDNPRVTRRIVGVVGDVVSAGVDPTAPPVLYLPYAQDTGPVMTFVLRARADGASVTRAARQAILATDRTLPVYDVGAMDDVVANSRWVSRFTMTLLGVFAILSVALVAAGTYAVLSFIVSQRTQEIGIRLALGATRGNILGMVVGRGAVLALIGCALGSLAFAWGHTMLSTLLYGVSAFDAAIAGSVIVTMVGITLLACYIPARTATRVSPVSALRSQ